MHSTGIRESRKCDPKGGRTVDSMTTTLGNSSYYPFSWNEYLEFFSYFLLEVVDRRSLKRSGCCCFFVG